MNRRDFFNLSIVTAVSIASGGCSTKTVQTKSILAKQLKAKKSKKRVVIVGGGFGGLNTASAIKQNDPYFRDIDDDAEHINATRKYTILNFIPLQKASSLITKAGLKTNA